MSLVDNIKKLRIDKGLRQKEIANAISIGYSNYNKIENGIREISVKELLRLANFYNVSVDDIIHFDEKTIPKEVIIEDKASNEQLRLISQLDEDDKAIIFKMIDKMLTSKKFKEFFTKNVASL